MRLFISKNENECQALKSFCEERDCLIHAQALIDFIPKENVGIPSGIDWIFFGSKNAVKYLLAENNIKDSVKIACVGKSTAKALVEKGYTVDFIGDKSGDPKEVGEEFAALLGQQRVYFPSSDISLGSIHDTIYEHQKVVEVIYQTISIYKKIPKSEVYIFTSPSNVIAFLKHNVLPEQCRIISWGKSTETTLLQRGHRFSDVLTDSSMEELIERLK